MQHATTYGHSNEERRRFADVFLPPRKGMGGRGSVGRNAHRQRTQSPPSRSRSESLELLP